eukprot:CAMPEP_0178908386 /NCGR_PEP_ID=MMETSP0786-20121207/7895_1 /TAXON_ID=186022 /ORGANISM="Thalassionema frauenfeldii, Strain CCMP 1798" /LENGTH=314 /DNA_ID=CAMNT_0020580285 /DNA_START=97 /DNA_END=1041 /DNA_ORIENTATION=+
MIRTSLSLTRNHIRLQRSASAAKRLMSQSSSRGKPIDPKTAKTSAGTGRPANSAGEEFSRHRGPVSWAAFGLIAVASASAVGYFQVERERRLERAMGKVVSSTYRNGSEEDEGWSPNPEFLAKRKWKLTKYGWFPEEDAFGGAGKPAIGGPWSLIDLDGNLVTNKTFEGKWLLLYFGFARCPDICPSEMLKVGRVMDMLKEEYPNLAQKIQPVFVSVDPARDSLKALREYGKDFHPSYVFLTGSPEQVQQMAKKYRVYVSKADETEDGDYLVDHSIVVYFHDDTGDLADCFTQSMRPKDVVEKVIERMTFIPTY